MCIGDHKSDFKAYSPLKDVFRVLSFDFRGHGQSSVTGPFTFRQLVDDIEAMRIHFAGPDSQIVLCGGSFGGYLAQQYGIEFPSRVSYLILRGTAPSFHREFHEMDFEAFLTS
jgi:proline iminopeptidase